MGGSLTGIALKDLLEAGVHFGHQTKRWNPKMKTYIFGERNGIYILDLGKTVKLFHAAEEFVRRMERPIAVEARDAAASGRVGNGVGIVGTGVDDTVQGHRRDR